MSVLRRVSPGDPLDIPASDYNAFIEAAKATRTQALKPPAKTSLAEGICLVKNSTENDLARFDVLGIDSVLFDPTDNANEFQNNWAMNGIAPAEEDHKGRFVVLLSALAAGKIGLARISGVCPVVVNRTSEAHRFAEITNGETGFLTSGPEGSAEILYHHSGSGWALVRLGNEGGISGGTGVGYGLVDAGTDDAPSATRLSLIWCDDQGDPILDAEEQPQVILVHRDTLRRALFIPFDAGEVFSFVWYQEPIIETVGEEEVEVVGCLYNRADPILNHNTYAPPTAYRLTGTEVDPVAQPGTGNPATASHIYVTGHMAVLDHANAISRAWFPWFTINPDDIETYKVKVTGAGSPGYLNDKITVVVPAADYNWLGQSVSSDTVLLQHKDWDSTHLTISDPVLVGTVTAGNGVTVEDEEPAGAYIKVQQFSDVYDAKHHSLVAARLDGNQDPIFKYISLPTAGTMAWFNVQSDSDIPDWSADAGWQTITNCHRASRDGADVEPVSPTDVTIYVKNQLLSRRPLIDDDAHKNVGCILDADGDYIAVEYDWTIHFED